MVIQRLVIAIVVVALITTAISSPTSHNQPNCVGCHLKSPQLAVQLKVEAIKEQILSKLHLKSRPNITQSMPAELVAEALRRARLHEMRRQERPWQRRARHNRRHDKLHEEMMREQQNQPQMMTNDDYYGKTSEVIAFAEPGE